MHKVMLSVAPVSAAPHPIVPEEIARDVYRCYQEGASMVHLHVRDENGGLTPDLSLLQETVERIRALCDIVIEVSTGGVSDLTIEERCVPCGADFVEAVSLNVGSVNLGKAVYRNPIDEVHYCVERLMKGRKFPEIEVFELGMIHTVKLLQEEHGLEDPLLFALVFGHEGEMPATKPALDHMLGFLKDTFGETALGSKILWGYTEAHRTDWEMVKYALSLGADTVRLGFEDADYLDPETQVQENWPLIRRAAELVRAQGYEPMTPEEVRQWIRR